MTHYGPVFHISVVDRALSGPGFTCLTACAHVSERCQKNRDRAAKRAVNFGGTVSLMRSCICCPRGIYGAPDPIGYVSRRTSRDTNVASDAHLDQEVDEVSHRGLTQRRRRSLGEPRTKESMYFRDALLTP